VGSKDREDETEVKLLQVGSEVGCQIASWWREFKKVGRDVSAGIGSTPPLISTSISV
jgi:hypothetical protein